MLNRWRMMVAALLTVCGLAGSASAQTAAPTITLDAAANGGSTIVAPGTLFAVSLPENPSTGYTWQLQPLAVPVVGVIGDRFVPETSSELRPGAGEHRLISFAALTPGTANLVLRLQRPGGAMASPSDTFSVTITVTPADRDQ